MKNDSLDTLDSQNSKKPNSNLLKRISLTVLAVVILAVSIISACNIYFYNPNRGVQPVYGGDGQLLVDMIAFTELHSPGYSTYSADSWRDGVGTYQVRISQQNLFQGKSEDYSGGIVRGKILSEGVNKPVGYWHFPLMNAFGDREGKFTYDENGEKIAPSQEYMVESLECLKKLPESSRAGVYITFSNDLTLAEFEKFYQKWHDKIDFYYAAVVSDDDYITSTVGFAPDSAGVVLEKNLPDKNDYPHFKLFQSGDEDNVSLWAQHFSSVLKYMSERSDFLEVMASVNGISADYYKKVLNYVNEKGINIYGVLISGNVEDVNEFLTNEEYYDFYVNGVRLSDFPD